MPVSTRCPPTARAARLCVGSYIYVGEPCARSWAIGGTKARPKICQEKIWKCLHPELRNAQGVNREWELLWEINSSVRRVCLLRLTLAIEVTAVGGVGTIGKDYCSLSLLIQGLWDTGGQAKNDDDNKVDLHRMGN